MPFLVALLVIALIIAFLFLSTLFIVPQQQAYIIERFGKFNKVQFAGIHIRIPFVDRIAMKTNMRVNQLNVQLETKTLDNVFVTVVASTQFRVNPENVFAAIAICGGPDGVIKDYCTPCGVCRQVMREFCNPSTFRILVAKSAEDYREYTLEQLLPDSFGPDDLEK